MLDEVLAELEAYERGRLSVIAEHGSMPGGGWALCGTAQDTARWTAAYVRADRAVVPLAVGARDRVVQELARIRREKIPVWDASHCSPPTVLVDGAAYHFTAAHGRRLLGVVKCKRGAVILAALGDEIAVIDVAGRRTSVLHIGRPCSFREIDVDAWRRYQRTQGRSAGPVPPRRVPRAVQAEHRRIVQGVEVDVEGGPTVAQVLEANFVDLAERALALAASGQREFKGQTGVPYLTGYLCKMAIAGFGKIARRIAGLYAFIKKHYPEFDMTLGLFADALTLLEATGTCVVPPRRPHQRIRLLNLEGLSDPSSPQHRQFCRETRARHQREAAGTAHVGEAPRVPRARKETAAAPPEPVRSDTSDPSPPPPSTTAAEISAAFRTAAASMLERAAATVAPRTTTTDPPSLSPAVPAAPPAEAGPVAASDAAVADGVENGSSGEIPVASRTGGRDAAASPDSEQAASGREELLLDAIKELEALGPGAGQALLLSFGISQGWVSNASLGGSAADPPVSDDAAPREEARPVVEPPRVVPRRSRRRLHLSPDHTLELPVVASALTRSEQTVRPSNQGQGVRGRGQVLGRSRPVGEGSDSRRARGPPSVGRE